MQWEMRPGGAVLGLAPAVTVDGVYVASKDGVLSRVNSGTGKPDWTIETELKLTSGPGADATMVVVGSTYGDVIAADTEGKEIWRTKVSSEAVAQPVVANGIVVIFTADNRIHGLSAIDGSLKWVIPRVAPALIVRNTQGAATSRGGLFVGTPGGRLLAIDLNSGGVAWDVAVATPKGTTELERIADVTSHPIVLDNKVCAAAFQGRVACFEIMRGTTIWARDIPSYAGIAADDDYLYVSDETGAIHALDLDTGASIWKNESLVGRWPSAPQRIGDNIGVIDIGGFLHVFSRKDGHYLGRLPTDGTPATAQPQLDADQTLWQSREGNVFAVVPK
jgi:outer membrane protein assembly factor BamB